MEATLPSAQQSKGYIPPPLLRRKQRREENGKGCASPLARSVQIIHTPLLTYLSRDYLIIERFQQLTFYFSHSCILEQKINLLFVWNWA